MAERSRGQLPKAYLRIDPNIDQTHPDVGGFVKLLCAAARQPERGRFKTRALLDSVLGRAVARRLVDRGDVVETEDGKWYPPGWDEWQEGDLTVGERQNRIRGRRRDTSVTSSHADNADVTLPHLPPSPSFPPPTTPSISPTPSRAEDSKAAGGARANGHLPDGFDDDPEGPAMTWLAQNGCYLAPSDGRLRQLLPTVEKHGVAKVIAQFERLKADGMEMGDTSGYIFGAVDGLRVRPPRKQQSDAERQHDETKAEIARMVAQKRREQQGGATQ